MLFFFLDSKEAAFAVFFSNDKSVVQSTIDRDTSVKYATMALNVLRVLDAGAVDSPDVSRLFLKTSILFAFSFLFFFFFGA